MNEKIVEQIILYFYHLFCLAFIGFWYWTFRLGIEQRLVRLRKISSMKLEKLKKGMKNYWFMEAIHQKVNLGRWYRINKIFVVLYFGILAIFLLGGCFPKVRLFISAVSLPLYCICIPMTILSNVEDNYERHDKPFVWFAIDKKIKKGAVDGIFVDLLVYGMIVMLAYTHVKFLFGF